MANDPLRNRSAKSTGTTSKPRIWAEGDQRPPFRLRTYGRAALHLSREAVAPLLAALARALRRAAINVRNGAGRIPEGKLGRVARFVPSHLRVAAWIKNLAAVLSHASATSDPDVKRGNALVAEIEPHLWQAGTVKTAPPAPEPPPLANAAQDVAPVVLAEPSLATPLPPEDDPLAAIRTDLGAAPDPADSAPARTPAPPGAVATAAIQVSGYGLGWLTSFVALPYGLVRAGLLHLNNVDLRKIGTED